MSYFDITLAIIVAAFTFNGLSKGLIRLLGKVVGLLAGAFLASHFYLVFYQWSQGWYGGRENLGKALSFIIVFIAATLIIDWVFVILEKIFNVISIIPFTKTINRLLGAVLGFLEGSLFIGLIIFVISRYALIGSLFGNSLSSSQLAPFFLAIANVALPFLPAALKALQSLV